jgi:hypothetical protein
VGRFISVVGVVLLAGLAASCRVDGERVGDGDQGGGAIIQPCVAGSTQECACGGGIGSTQTCNPDGMSFGPCNCGNSGASGVSAGASGVGASGVGAAGQAGNAGAAGPTAGDGASGTSGGAGAGGDQDASTGTDPEPGRLAGITEAHNAVRRNVSNPAPSPALADLTWSTSLATTAQAYADQLAATCAFQHSPGAMSGKYGENLAKYSGQMVAPEAVVDGWASEVDCWTYGTKADQNGNDGTEQCDAVCIAQHHSNGCGHYTALVWRGTTMVGCGLATCSGSPYQEIWVCNYSPAGNFIGNFPY